MAGGTWSGGLRTCVPLNCPDRIKISNTSFLFLLNSSCTRAYLSQCITNCREGFAGDDVIYLCNVTSDPAVVDWVPKVGVHLACERGLLYITYTVQYLRNFIK